MLLPLPPQQHEGRGDGDQRHHDAVIRGGRIGAARQTAHGTEQDRGRRDDDQHDLEDRRQRLRLAVAETMLGISRLGGEPHAPKRRAAGDQVEPGIGEAAEHRGRAGAPCKGRALARQRRR